MLIDEEKALKLVMGVPVMGLAAVIMLEAGLV